MDQPIAKNAIERRIDLLGELWNEFAENPEPRFLRWLTDGDGAGMIDAFLEVQNGEGGDIPDLFLRFNTPFDDPESHGFRLIEAFQAMYEESREVLAEEGIDDNWVCPEPRDGTSDIEALVNVCVSFREHYEGLMLNLAIALLPDAISDPGDWQDWLGELVQAGLPETVRVTVVDRTEAPLLNELAESEPALVSTITPDLDMSGAMNELAKQAGGTGPGAEFRRLYVELTNLASKGDMELMNRKAEAALSIARQENWPALQVAVHLLLAATHLGAGRTDDSIGAYRAGGEAAAEAQKQEDPSGGKLVVQCRFGEASALMADKRYDEAALVYEQTGPVAEEGEDYFMALEAWRMAGYCHQQTGDSESAWQRWLRALDAAEKLDESVRQNSTLPYVGEGLLRLARSYPYKDEADKVRARMAKLAGPDWEEKLQQGGS